MKVVSNTGPIIGLAKIAGSFLLKSMFEEVLIPPLVHRELFGKVGSESEEIERALNDFIHIADLIPLEPATERATADLDEGEKQAISAYELIKPERIRKDEYQDYKHNIAFRGIFSA
ncbi:MAG: hypothetical protein HWN68_07050 [Desulfobacterales bacterium]|nr:hypothetical protein [Desulfobacterales bacterium]